MISLVESHHGSRICPRHDPLWQPVQPGRLPAPPRRHRPIATTDPTDLSDMPAPSYVPSGSFRSAGFAPRRDTPSTPPVLINTWSPGYVSTSTTSSYAYSYSPSVFANYRPSYASVDLSRAGVTTGFSHSRTYTERLAHRPLVSTPYSYPSPTSFSPSSSSAINVPEHGESEDQAPAPYVRATAPSPSPEIPQRSLARVEEILGSSVDGEGESDEAWAVGQTSYVVLALLIHFSSQRYCSFQCPSRPSTGSIPTLDILLPAPGPVHHHRQSSMFAWCRRRQRYSFPSGCDLGPRSRRLGTNGIVHGGRVPTLTCP